MDHNEKIKKLYDAACKDVLSEQGLPPILWKSVWRSLKSLSRRLFATFKASRKFCVVLFNPQGEVTRIETRQNEDKRENESTVTFDVHFTVFASGTGEEIKRIIDLEAQNDFPRAIRWLSVVYTIALVWFPGSMAQCLQSSTMAR